MNVVKVSVGSLLMGAACQAGGLFIAGHHPLAAELAVAGSLVVAIACLAFPQAWLFLLPALLPVVDLAPWTGWITFEEFDIVVLAAAAGLYLRRGWKPRETERSRSSLLLATLAAGLVLTAGIALARGLQDAGGLELGWFQGYEGPMNSLRLAKPLLWALLFVPFMKPAVMRPGSPGIPWLAWGLAAGLALASLAALWERVAFPGLLNFSADYRTTALFWEMHVGGAALDGFLVLTVPFAAWLLLASHGPRQFVPAALVLGLAGYASLTTFSRGVYAALLLSLPLLGWLLWRQQGHTGRGVPQGRKWGVVGARVAWGVVGLLAAHWVFRSGGYRGLGAVLGVFALAVTSGPLARAASGRQLILALVFGGVAGALAGVLGLFLEKGPYLVYAAFLATAASFLVLQRRGSAGPLPVLAAASALLVAAGLVAGHWGGSAALADAAVVLVLLLGLAIWNARAPQALWPEGRRAQGVLVLGVAALAAVVAVFGGGQYMGNRFAAAEQDLQGRLKHWGEGLALLAGPADWILGKGSGRFPANFFFGAPGNEFPGAYQIAKEGGTDYLTLSGPRYQIGYGEVLRVSQRVPLMSGSYRLEFDLRAPRDVALDLGLCEKHLLYREACARKTVQIKGDGEGAWRHQVVELDARHMDGGPWYAPQLVVFFVALETLQTRVDLDNLSLQDAMGARVLENGDFEAGMSRWFITSDHHHLPWHMKNLFLHVLFEQGLLGLTVFLCLVVAALARLTAGRNRRHPLAPAMAAALAGFLVVGLFDSLLDVPRVAFLFLLLALMAIQASRREG